jgi:Fe-S cluster assembly ATP-binding protein
MTTAAKEKLVISGLHVSVDGQEILKGVDLEIGRGEIHALMGPNGSGKSTLGYAIMGHPSYEVTAGTIELVAVDGSRHDLLVMEPDQRARAGVFLAFQRPMSIPGVRLADFLRHAVTNVRNPDRKEGQELMPMRDFRAELKSKMGELSMDTDFARRYVNDGFSGGEMKRAEILQLAMLRPKFAVLDETDSGLDADAVRLASQSIARIGSGADSGNAEMGILIITHHEQLLEHNIPHRTHVMLGGRIVESGGSELAAELHKRGYERIRAAYPEAAAAERVLEQSAAPVGARA